MCIRDSLYIKNGEVDNAVVCAAEEICPFAQAVCDTEIYDCCGAVYLSSNISDIEIECISRLVPENKQESINISVSAEFISLLQKSILDKETEIYISAGKSERYIKLKYLNLSLIHIS